ncbi:hypothetical protein Ahy_Scaffold1g107342 isoform E [Arachis hypogaea]|uniref:Uncharacterized protein n=1 Tax=Arachis hypogaea TaxID=3818 RepID=A0A444WVG5_ARAHY|nr:hypothetical protein Ahy_Scaffold1g107342 isoform E [Arachis hypogaea]
MMIEPDHEVRSIGWNGIQDDILFARNMLNQPPVPFRQSSRDDLWMVFGLWGGVLAQVIAIATCGLIFAECDVLIVAWFQFPIMALYIQLHTLAMQLA